MSLLFALDNFEFVNSHLAGNPGTPPPVVDARSAIVARAGVNDVGIIRDAVRGQPFQFTTKVDVLNRPLAHQLLNSYRALIVAKEVDLIWGGVNFASAHKTQYVVLAVRPIQIRTVGVPVGGFTTGAAAAIWLECLWDLVPVIAS